MPEYLCFDPQEVDILIRRTGTEGEPYSIDEIKHGAARLQKIKMDAIEAGVHYIRAACERAAKAKDQGMRVWLLPGPEPLPLPVALSLAIGLAVLLLLLLSRDLRRAEIALLMLRLLLLLLGLLLLSLLLLLLPLLLFPLPLLLPLSLLL